MFTHIYILTYPYPVGPIGRLSGGDIMTYIGVNISLLKIAIFSMKIKHLQHIIGA